MYTYFLACFHSGIASFILGIHPLKKTVDMVFVLLDVLCGDWCFIVNLFAEVSGWRDCVEVKHCEGERMVSEKEMEQKRDFEEC